AAAWKLFPVYVEHILPPHVVAAALLVSMQVGDVVGDLHTLDIEPGPGADTIPSIHPRRVAFLLLAEIGTPGASRVRAAQGLRFALTYRVGAGEPAEIARLFGVLGNEEAYYRLRLGSLRRQR